jgi:hypothetical protein
MNTSPSRRSAVRTELLVLLERREKIDAAFHTGGIASGGCSDSPQ